MLILVYGHGKQQEKPTYQQKTRSTTKQWFSEKWDDSKQSTFTFIGGLLQQVRIYHLVNNPQKKKHIWQNAGQGISHSDWIVW